MDELGCVADRRSAVGVRSDTSLVCEVHSVGEVCFDTRLGREARFVSEMHFGAAVQGEGPSGGEVRFDMRLNCGAHFVSETHFDAAVQGEGPSGGEVRFDMRLKCGARFVTETHFDAAVQGEGRSAGEAYYDTWLGCGAHSAIAHFDAALSYEARGIRLESGICPAIEQNTGWPVQAPSRFDAPTSAQGL